MGVALKELGWRRSSYIVSTKFFWGLHDGPNEKNTLNRKYLMQAHRRLARALAARFRRPRLLPPRRPGHADRGNGARDVDMIAAGKALYWGTSEWTAAEIAAAWHVADRHHLHKPVTEQPQYNLFHRERVEKEYARLYADIGLGTTIWSPLASGLLTGKYNDGIPPDSRGTLKGYEWLAGAPHRPGQAREGAQARADRAELGCTLAQLSLAWCLKNPHVSTVITGASRPRRSSRTCRRWTSWRSSTPDVMARIDASRDRE